MEGVESVTQLDDAHLHWLAEMAGTRREWDAEISEQHPDERLAWRATDGTSNAGAVTFHRLDDTMTRSCCSLRSILRASSRRLATCWGLCVGRSLATREVQRLRRRARSGKRWVARRHRATRDELIGISVSLRTCPGSPSEVQAVPTLRTGSTSQRCQPRLEARPLRQPKETRNGIRR